MGPSKIIRHKWGPLRIPDSQLQEVVGLYNCVRNPLYFTRKVGPFCTNVVRPQLSLRYPDRRDMLLVSGDLGSPPGTSGLHSGPRVLTPKLGKNGVELGLETVQVLTRLRKMGRRTTTDGSTTPRNTTVNPTVISGSGPNEQETSHDLSSVCHIFAERDLRSNSSYPQGNL